MGEYKKDKELGFNYFTIVKAVELSESLGYYRITIANNYVRTNDVDVILNCERTPKIGEHIEFAAKYV